MILKRSLYPFLFILYYLLAAFIEVKEIITIPYFITIFILTIVSCLLLASAVYFIYKSWKKSFLFSFIFLFLYLQYNTIYEGLLKIKGFAFLIKHSVLLIMVAIVLVCCFLLIKKYKLNNKVIVTLNLCYTFLLIFSLIQFISLGAFTKNDFKGEPSTAWAGTRCDTCKKPDIFLIVYDEYASSSSLKRRFGYNNTLLDSFLLAENFKIQNNSSSNYNSTIFSMLSFLRADYLQNFTNKNYFSKKEEINAHSRFQETSLINYLKNNNYTVFNFSIFPLSKNDDFDRNAPLFSSHPLLSSSIYYTLINDIEPTLLKNKFLKFIFSYGLYKGKREMEQLERDFYACLNSTRQSNPSFYYLHQLAPHWIFYYDKNGKEPDFNKVLMSKKTIHQGYVEYLQYCNKKIIQVIKSIKKATDNNAVIIFIGDHGFRHGIPVADKEHFANQNAIYFPDSDYHLLYDSISNVNITRVLLNKYFKLNLPLLKDASIYIKKEK